MKIEVGGAATRRGVEAQQQRIRDIAAALGERYTVKLSLPPGEAEKLGWFNNGVAPHQPARPVWVASPEVQRRVLDAVGARVRGDLAKAGRVNMLLALQAGAQAYREAWVARLSTSGGDLRWAPLSPAYAWRKHLRGLDPREGVATGKMLAAVRAALVVVQRTG